MFTSVFSLFISSVFSAVITNSFNCDVYDGDSSTCQEIGWCYYDWNSDLCVKDDCLEAVATDSSPCSGGSGCEIDEYEYGTGCTPSVKYYCRDTARHIYDSCFERFVAYNGQCADTDHDTCVIDSTSYTGGGSVCSEVYGDWCNEVGTTNCQMEPSCAIVSGVCVTDVCAYSSPSSCATANGCANYTVYTSNGQGATYQISTTTRCGQVNKYGSADSRPDPCSNLDVTYQYPNDVSPSCNSWDGTGTPPASTTHCKVTTRTYCGETYCNTNCNEAANNNCTSASGISGVTCSVQTDSDGDTYCSDGRSYDTGAASFIRSPFSAFAILLATVFVALYLN